MITQEMKDKGMLCRGQGFNCHSYKDKNECLDYEHNGLYEKDIKIQDKCIYPNVESNQKEVLISDLLKELLTNPRIEGITINIERVGDLEETHINAKLKEIEWLHMDTSKIDYEEMKKFEEALKNIQPSSSNIFNWKDISQGDMVIKS